MSDAAVATIVTGIVTVVTMVVGFLTLWVKLRYGVETKIEAGTSQASENAKAAAVAATATATKTEEIAHRLNGGLDDRIRAAIKEHTEPIATTLKEHTAQDDRNMREIRDSLADLRKQRTK